MKNRHFAHLAIALFAIWLAGCQPAALNGPSLQLLNASDTQAETAVEAETAAQVDIEGDAEPEIAQPRQVRTLGDLLANAEAKPAVAVKQTVTAQAQQINAMLATPEPTEAVATPETVPEAPTSPAAPALPDKFAESLAAHNDVRAETGIPPLIWDPEYAQASQQWADVLAEQGVLQHDPDANVWENVSQQVAGTAADEIVKGRLYGWASDEEREIFAATNGCPFDHEDFVLCGHYRVITNPELTTVGCGVTTNGDWDFWVCRFR